MFVAPHDQHIEGTASLDGNAVRAMFVARSFKDTAIRAKVLVVPTSLTAVPFYASLGCKAVHDCFHGEERTVIKERTWTKPRRNSRPNATAPLPRATRNARCGLAEEVETHPRMEPSSHEGVMTEA